MARINKMEMRIIKTVYYPNAAGWRKEETVGVEFQPQEVLLSFDTFHCFCLSEKDEFDESA